MDKLTPEQRKRNMQAVKSKGSKIEIALGKALWKLGLRYRKNDKTIFGTPDFSFKKYKVAVFCDSEFWHGKNWHRKKHEHKSNVKFWHQKIERSIERDKDVNKTLIESGWTVIRFWGKDIIENPGKCARKVFEVIHQK